MKIEIRPPLRFISSQVINHRCELASYSETRNQYKNSIGPDFRYQSRVTCHMTSKLAKKHVKMKPSGVKRAVRFYVIGLELDETYSTIYVSRSSKVKIKVTGLPKFEIRPTLRSISAQDMDHQWELTSDSETRNQYKIILRPVFRYRSRDFRVGEKGRHNQTQWSHKAIFDLDRAR